MYKKHYGLKYSLIRAIVGASIICTSIIQTAHAEITFNGFASFKTNWVSDEGNDLDQDGVVTQQETAFDNQYSNNLSFKEESLIGLQASTQLSDTLRATFQFIAEGNNDYNIETQWAYLTYDFTHNWSIKAGRIVLPAFYKSEFSKVGYAYNYAKLPYSVYIETSFSSVDGVRLDNISYWGDWKLNTTVGYSNWKDDVAIASLGQKFTGEVSNIINANFELNKDWLTLFAGGFTAESDFPSIDEIALEPYLNQMLAAGFINTDERNVTLNALSFSGDVEYYYYGLDIDYHDWLLTAEYTDYGIEDSGDSFTEAWYISIGKRIDNVTLLYTHGDFTQPIDYSDVNNLPQAAQPFALQVKQTLSTQRFSTNTLTLRYDFHPKIAFKADIFIWDTLKSGKNVTGFVTGFDMVF